MSQKKGKRKVGNLEVFNYLLSSELEELMARSALIVSRSGYSTIMDLQALGARAFFIPTPGQTEQEYLANHLEERGVAGFSRQGSFGRDSLEKAFHYQGFQKAKTPNENQFKGLFDVF